MVRDMTKGRPGEILLKFTLPMLVGNLFQQLYNIVDSVVVGRFIGKNALAAVGSAFMAMNFFSFVIIGLCMGSSIVYSYYFGENNENMIRKSIFTSFFFIGIFTISLSIVLVLGTEKILVMMNTPGNILADSVSYLEVIFGGLVFVFLYNGSVAVLRSIGDSKTPLIFLILSAVINIILDLYFVIGLKMGVEGVAYATVIAQGVSSILCMVYANIKIPMLRIGKEDMVFESKLVKDIGRYSILTSIQQSIMTFGMLVVQGFVNKFGADTIAAFAAGGKIESIANLPMQDFGNAFGTYVAQNKGARKPERIARGLRSAISIILIFGIIISTIIYTNSERLMRIFVQDWETQVIDIGVEYMSILSVFYTLLGFLFMFYGYYRGLGELNTSLFLTIVSLGTRVIIVAVFSKDPSIGRKAIWWAAPIGWFLADLMGVFFHFIRRDKRKEEF